MSEAHIPSPVEQRGRFHRFVRTGSFGRVLQNVGWLIAGKGVGAVLSLIYLGMATRTLGIEGFGQFVFIVGIAQGVSTFASFQSWQMVVRYGLIHLKANDGPALTRVTDFGLMLDFGAAAVGTAIATLGIILAAPYMGWDHDIEMSALAFTAVMILSPRQTSIGLLRLHDRFGLGAAGDAVTPIARMVGALVTVAVGATVTGFLITWAAAEFITFIACWWAAARVTGYRPKFGRLFRSVREVPVENPGIWHFIWITNIGSTLTSGVKQLIIVPVGLVAGASSAGAFRLAAQIGQAIAKSAQMLARSLFAEIARVHVDQDRAELIRLFRTTCTVTGAAALIIILALGLLGGQILTLIAGSHYHGAQILLVLLGVAAAMDVGGVGFTPALLATGKASLSFRLSLIGTGALILLMVWLLPAYGVTGAAWAMLIGSALTTALLGIAAWIVIHEPPQSAE